MTETTAAPRRSKVATTVLWISRLAALAVAAAGVAKFFPSTRWQGFFVNWGYPAWFALVVGAAEAVSGVLTWIPRFAFYGATLLGSIMVAAAITLQLHRNVPPGWSPRTNLVYVVVFAAGAALRWHDRARLSK